MRSLAVDRRPELVAVGRLAHGTNAKHKAADNVVDMQACIAIFTSVQNVAYGMNHDPQA